MEKLKAIMRIDSYSNGQILLSVEDWSVKSAIRGLIDLCESKYSSYIRLEMSAPYKARTTGAGSQNNLIWALITEIAKKTGNELEDVEQAAKERAVKRGYPFKQNKITGQIMPLSMTKIDTQQAGFLIDELYAIAAEYEININGVN